MGNATIWYRPEGANKSVRINLGRRLRSREGPNVQYRSTYSESLGGLSVTVTHSGRMDVRIGLTWQRTGTDGTDAGSQLRRRLWGLQAHLKRGGYCTFAEDADYCWAAFASKLPTQGEVSLPFNPAITRRIAPNSSPLGREIYTHSDAESYLTEMKLCDNVFAAASYLTVDGFWLEDYSRARWVLIREAGTYPAMRVPPSARGQNFLSHDNDRVFHLELPLEEDHDRLEDLAARSGELTGEDEGPGSFEPVPWDPGHFDPFGPVRYRF